MARDVGIALVAVVVLAGCASSPSTPDVKAGKLGPGAVTMHEDQDFDWAWTAPGLNFATYDTLYLAEPRADVKDLKPDDAESLEWARALLPEKFLAVLRDSKLFQAVVTRD